MLAAGRNVAWDDLSPEIASEIERKITSLVKLAGSLQMMLEEASGFQVFIARSGETFDHAEFEVENGQGEPVLCATSIGLIKEMPSGVGQSERVMVLKAKVLLKSFLDSLH